MRKSCLVFILFISCISIIGFTLYAFVSQNQSIELAQQNPLAADAEESKFPNFFDQECIIQNYQAAAIQEHSVNTRFSKYTDKLTFMLISRHYPPPNPA